MYLRHGAGWLVMGRSNAAKSRRSGQVHFGFFVGLAPPAVIFLNHIKKLAAPGESVASQRDGRGALMARRDAREYRGIFEGRSIAANGAASRLECSQSFTTGR